MNKAIKIAISFLISAGLLAYVLSQIEWRVVSDEIASARWMPIIVTTLIWVAHFWVRAIRWKYLLPENTQTSVMLRFESILIGVFATFLLPLRAGEFIRPIYLAKYSQVNFTQGFVSVFIERFFDLVWVLAMFAWISVTIPNLPAWTVSGAIFFGSLAAGIFVFIILCLVAPGMILKIAQKVTQLLPAKVGQIVLKIINDVIAGARAIGTAQRFIMTVILTNVIWGANILIFYGMLAAISLPMDWMLSITLTVLVALAVAAPSAPGFIGVYQVAAVACFALFGLSAEKATAYSLLSHAQQYVLYSVIGVAILLKRGLSLRSLRSEAAT